MKFAKKTVVVILIFSVSSVYANNDQMNEALVNVIQELQSIKVLLNKAEKVQDKDARIKIHFNNFTGADGVRHRGLKSDVSLLQAAMVSFVNKETIEPRVLDPIRGDFIGEGNE